MTSAENSNQKRSSFWGSEQALLGGASEYMVTQSIYVQLNNLGDYSGSAAQATILLVIILCLLIVLRRAIANPGGSSAAQTSQRSILGNIPEALVDTLGEGPRFFISYSKSFHTCSWL